MIHRSSSLRTSLVLLTAWLVAAATGPVQAAGSSEAAELVRISDVQGSGATVALAGPVAVEAVVTSLFEDDDQLSGFFLQEEDADRDGDPATSEGIFVYCSAACPVGLAVGDRVRVEGLAGEFGGASQINAASGGVTVRSSGNDLPTATAVSLPARGSTRAEGTFENVEGMLVTFPGKLVVSEYYWLARYGELVLTEGSRPYQFTHRHLPSDTGYAAFLDDLATRRIILDDGNGDQNEAIFPPQGEDEAYPYPGAGLSNTNRFRGGDSIRGLTGVMHWAVDAWRIQPVPERFDYTFAADNPRPTVPAEVGGRLRVAGFNVLNYFATIDDGTPRCGPDGGLGCRGADSVAELGRQRDKIVAAMSAIDAHVLGVVEIENDDSASLADLVAGLNAAAGAGRYAYVDTGTIGSDVIKVGLVYQPGTVKPVGRHTVIDSSVDAAFLDTKNRPGLIQTFEEASTGERFTVAVNHLKSKGSSCDDLGDPDLRDGQGNCSSTRTSASAALARYLATDPTSSGDPDILIIGDLNAYAREDPIRALEVAGYTDLIRRFEGVDAYGYLFDGQLGYLDHALASPSLLRQVTGAAGWYINADEPPLFDYNDDVLDAGERSYQRESAALPLYEAGAFRSSDHDPVIIGLQLGRSATAGRPAPGGEAPVVETPFTDLGDASDAHRDNIRRIYGLGMTVGTSEATFSPARPVSLPQAASFLARLFKAVEGEDTPPVETPFTDLGDASIAHRDNIRRIYGLGVIAGEPVTTFSPDACVARGRMATLLARFYAVVTGSLAPMAATPFTDLDGTATGPSGDIGRIYGLGLTEGTSLTTFSPDACTTRQQMASFLARAYRTVTTAIRSLPSPATRS
ncbi:ExeM/NucH family extracellular endonuclease [Candidatus Spongiisocius sp.]|uniref:ExeM/NucH family extracellular endonuclease n=1 Tax=Candidatus Spongiisocius sp. TaxID=3101273 RepID=UPI003B58F42F